MLGTSSYGYSVESFSWTGSVGSSPFINRFDSGLGTPYDIDISGSLIWVACDGADSPVKAYNTKKENKGLDKGVGVMRKV